MSPSDKLRDMLDERGIAWVAIAESVTEYAQEGIVYRAYEVCGGLQVAIVTPVTPEQAIAATVGAEPDEATMLKLHGRMNAVLLDYESAMGIEGGNGANTVPFVIEMHKIIEDAAKAGVGTCRAVVCNQSDCVHNREYRCACTDLEIQDQECLTYRCRYIDYDEEEE